MDKLILDACCGGRMMWFNKHHPAALYADCRNIERQLVWHDDPRHGYIEVRPDITIDFRHMPFPAESFPLVVFDPPHLCSIKENSYMAKKYGVLPGNWQEYIHAGFAECWRVLKPNGTLIFKWSEHNIPVSEIIAAIGHQPLFGHKSGKQSKTHWLCFFKIGDLDPLC
jgi:SAM-dependent methyltransferase